MNITRSNESLHSLRSKVISAGHASASGSYVESARGAIVRDVEGTEYIDFAGGIAVMNVGHSHPKVVAAIKDQAEKFTHTCFMVLPYEPAVRLAAKLEALTPGTFPKSTLFLNSGAEAVENAVKVARYATKKPAIIACEHGYHGRTLLTMTLTSKVKPYKYGFGPFAPEVYRMPYAYCYRCPIGLNYPDCGVACADLLSDLFVKQIDAEHTAALIVEPIAGEGGFITPPPEYFLKLKAICEQHGVLFIADEIQTGIGRTGAMFAMEHWGVVPDLVTSAKSLAAGMPLSAVIGRKDLMDAVHTMGVGGTYGGNPVSCRAGLAVLEIFEEEDLLHKAQTLGEKLRTRFEAWFERFEVIGEVRGIGPMLGLELVTDRQTKEPAAEAAADLVSFCHANGLILLKCGMYNNVIRVLIPLVITEEQLERGLTIMEEGLAQVSQGT